MGRERAKKVATFFVDLLKATRAFAEKNGMHSAGLTDKIDEVASTISAIDQHNPPKKLDWIVFAGFAVFMVAIIGAIFGENIRWLGAAFIIMPIVIGFGLINNIKNNRPDWGQTDQDIELNLHNAPQSLKQMTGSSSNRPKSKWHYRFTLMWVSLAGLFFFGAGLYLLFAADNF